MLNAFAVVLLSGTLFSCSEDMPTAETEAGDVILSVRSIGPSTRATSDDSFNENKISNILFLFAPEGSEDEENAVIKKRPGINTTSDYTTSVTFSRSEREYLFGISSSCRLYVLVNYKGDTDNIKSIADAKKIQITSGFDSNQEQSDFVMEGESKVSVNLSNYKGTGSVEVSRLASRFNLNVTVKDKDKNDVEYITDANDNKWYPQRDKIIVCINDAQRMAKVGDKIDNLAPDADGYFKTTPSNNTQTNLTVGSDNVASHAMPIYTYMNKWDVYDPKNMTYFIIQLPWKKNNEQSFRYCYYQIPATKNGKIERNFAYSINLNIGMLGSFEEAEPFLIEDLEYSILPWNNLDMGVELNKIDYLVVNNPEVSVYNEKTITIPIYSTADLTVSNITMTYPVFNLTGNAGSTAGNAVDVMIDEAKNNNSESYGGKLFTYSINKVDANLYELEITHDMFDYDAYNSRDTKLVPNDYNNSNYNNYINNTHHLKKNGYDAYSKFTFNVTIQHIGDASFKRNLILTQYPAVYITSEQNPYKYEDTFSYTYYNTNGSQNTNSTSKKGLVFVNSEHRYRNNLGFQCKGGATGNTTLTTSWGQALQDQYWSSTGNNNNPNIYTINISRLKNEGYILGDSREDIYSNIVTDNNTVWAYAPAVDKTNRNIKYYRETKTNKLYISPAFKIASSYGKTMDVSYDIAKRRCASYQEAGYPAGRWRIPTESEVAYVISLSSRGVIPVLFDNGGNYWTSTGYITPNNSTAGYSVTNSTNGSRAVRCVYDEWFWGNEKISDPEKFTWGDMPISDVSGAPRRVSTK